MGESICNNVSDKELVSSIYKELLQFNKKTTQKRGWQTAKKKSYLQNIIYK